MRRWLTLLLLVLMPLQFSWAAAAVYCQHERVGHARHVGHHEHAHASAETAKPSSSATVDATASATPDTHAAKAPAGKLSIDNDCGACHFSAVRPMATGELPLPRPGAQLLHDAGAQRFSTRAPDHPERPNWRIA